MKKDFRRVLLGLAIIGMLFTVIGPAQQVGAAQRTFADLKNHWAAGYINEWNSLGLVSGYPDGTFGPARLMTKAEFITFVNRALGYTKLGENTFTDVKKNDWFAGDVAKAIGMGYTQGNANGTFQPNQPINRLEAARILYKILRLEPVSQDSLAEYKDAGSLSAADKPMVNSIVAGGYFGGYPDKTLRMSSTITRAEMIVILARGAGEIMNVATTFGPATGTQTINGNATINKTGITLRNTTIKGDLYITEGVGDGDFWLKNVTVLGRTIVAGGGSGHVEGTSQLAQLIITYPDGSTHVVFADTASANDVEFRTAGDLDTSGSTSNTRPTVTISDQIPAGSTVTVVGDFANITVNAPGVTFQMGEGSTAENVTASETATGSTMDIQGDVTGSVTSNAPDSTTNIGSTASVNNVITSETATGSQTNVEGQVATLENQAPNSSTIIASTATVTNVTATETAAGSSLVVSGNVTTLTQNAPQATTTVAPSATVATLIAGSTATDASVTVQGHVTELQTSAQITVSVAAGGSLQTVQLQQGATGTAITTGQGATTPTVTAPPDVVWDNNGHEQTGGTTPPTPPSSGGDGGDGDGSSSVVVSAINVTSGTAKVGVVLTAGTLTPPGATASYQWQISNAVGGTYANIAGAIANTYTPVPGDVNKFIKVVATGIGSYYGTVASLATGAVAMVDNSALDVTAENFNTNIGTDYLGVNVGWNIGTTDSNNITSMTVELLDGNRYVLATNTGKMDKLKTVTDGIFSTPFFVDEGTYAVATDAYWTFGEWTPKSEMKPATAVITITDVFGTEYTDEIAPLTEPNGWTWESLFDIPQLVVAQLSSTRSNLVDTANNTINNFGWFAVTLSSPLDLSTGSKGNFAISYEFSTDDGATWEQAKKNDGTVFIKDKTWTGYLNREDGTTRYPSASYAGNIVPADAIIDSNETKVGERATNAYAAIIVPNAVVKVRTVLDIMDNYGNKLNTIRLDPVTYTNGVPDNRGIDIYYIYVNASVSTSGNGSSANPYKTITEALAAAKIGDTVIVAAGTYEENIIIDKELTLRGPNAGKAGNASDRTAEAVIKNTKPMIENGTCVNITSKNVTVEGFTIEGGETGRRGIYCGNAYTVPTDINVTVQNNRLVKFGWHDNDGSYGRGIAFDNYYGSSYVYGIQIKNNFVEYAYGGIVLGVNAYADVSGNQVESCFYGLQVVQFNKPLPTEMVNDYTLHNNQITINNDYGWNNNTGMVNADQNYEKGCMGIYFNIIGGGVTAIAKDNTITASSDIQNIHAGINVNSLNGGYVKLVNNIINNVGSGIRVWSTQTSGQDENTDPYVSQNLQILGGTIVGGKYGINITDWYWLPGFDESTTSPSGMVGTQNRVFLNGNLQISSTNKIRIFNDPTDSRAVTVKLGEELKTSIDFSSANDVVKVNADLPSSGMIIILKSDATAPSPVVLTVGTTPVGGVTQVVIPAAGATDATGAVTGWASTSANMIKFTVTDTGTAVSAITIGGVAYISGADYVIAAAGPLSIVVTTTEAGKVTGVRTFTVTVN